MIVAASPTRGFVYWLLIWYNIPAGFTFGSGNMFTDFGKELTISVVAATLSCKLWTILNYGGLKYGMVHCDLRWKFANDGNDVPIFFRKTS